MVDKVDRPDPVKKYEILSTKETRDEGQRKEDERRDDDEYSTPGTETSWNKFRVGVPSRQSLSLQRTAIRQAIFRQALLQSRAAVLEVDLTLTDGRTFQRAQILSSNMDDYWKWKGWMPGQVLPMELMVRGPLLEISIQTAGPAQIKIPQPQPAPVVRGIDWLWVAKIGASLILGLWIIGKFARWW